jgi:hypothetical protein
VEDLLRRCKDCGAEFALSAGQIAWFKAKGLTVPFRCQRCRDAAQFWRDVRERRDEIGPITLKAGPP